MQQGTRHAHERFTWKHGRAFGNGADVDGELDSAQPCEKRRIKQRGLAGRLQRGEVLDVVIGEAKAIDELGYLVGAAEDAVTSAKGIIAIERVEARISIDLALRPVALGHRDLVQIGEQRHVARHVPLLAGMLRTGRMLLP